jgi:hypothetical protein
MAGKNGTSNYGTDPSKPWGRMKHIFWPRCTVSGQIITQQGPVNFAGKGMLSHALQGMKPHFAAGRWNFANFQSPNYSAVVMEFTTPKSYGETVVAVGGIAKDGKIVVAGASPNVKAEHTTVKGDPDNDWPEPGAAKFTWSGEGTEATLSGEILPRVDRVDVMGELPKFVKQIATQASGTKPYIYQVSNAFLSIPPSLLTCPVVHAEDDARDQRREGGGSTVHGGDVHLLRIEPRAFNSERRNDEYDIQPMWIMCMTNDDD